ncbi:MAG: JAB domain-containing protein [Novosphingobium sp.]
MAPGFGGNSSDTAQPQNVLKELLPDDGIERFAAAFLRSGTLVSAQCLAEGTLAVVSLRARTIMQAALHVRADAMFLAHNHPSGNVVPSAADLKATLYLRRIATALEIVLLDHLIFADAHVFSMKSGRRGWTG